MGTGISRRLQKRRTDDSRIQPGTETGTGETKAQTGPTSIEPTSSDAAAHRSLTDRNRRVVGSLSLQNPPSCLPSALSGCWLYHIPYRFGLLFSALGERWWGPASGLGRAGSIPVYEEKA
jgi:hypothetical protein